MDSTAEAHATTSDTDMAAAEPADVNAANVAAAENATPAAATTATSTVPRFGEAATRHDRTDHERDKSVAHASLDCIERARAPVPEEEPWAGAL